MEPPEHTQRGGKREDPPLDEHAQFTRVREFYEQSRAVDDWIERAGLPQPFVFAGDLRGNVTECPLHPGHACAHMLDRGERVWSRCTLHGDIPESALVDYVNQL